MPYPHLQIIVAPPTIYIVDPPTFLYIFKYFKSNDGASVFILFLQCECYIFLYLKLAEDSNIN